MPKKKQNKRARSKYHPGACIGHVTILSAAPWKNKSKRLQCQCTCGNTFEIDYRTINHLHRRYGATLRCAECRKEQQKTKFNVRRLAILALHENPHWTLVRIAQAFGCDESLVSRIISGERS